MKENKENLELKPKHRLVSNAHGKPCEKNNLAKIYTLLKSLSIFLLIGFVASQISCSSTNTLEKGVNTGVGKSGAVLKVKKFRVREISTPSIEPMIPFERESIMHGAVSSREMAERYGDYLTVIWKSENRGSAKLKLEYRLQNSGSQLFTKVVNVPRAKRRNVTKFNISGSEFAEHGALQSWQITVLQGNQEVGKAQSYLWN